MVNLFNDLLTMSTANALLLVGAIVLFFWYATIVRRMNSAKEALAGIDVQLTKRASLIPNILKIARSFMAHERTLLNEITELRTKVLEPYDPKDTGAVAEHLEAARRLSARMDQLLVSVEDYPDLRSVETMVAAQQAYSEVELQIAAARRFYNSAVGSLNASIQIFPGRFLALLAGVRELPFFEADEVFRQPIDADNYLVAS